MLQSGVPVVIPKMNPKWLLGVLARVPTVNAEPRRFVNGITGVGRIKVFKVNFALTSATLVVRIFIDAAWTKNSAFLKRK